MEPVNLLSFACSLRDGEILGLTWDNVHISDDDIGKDDAHVYIDKELMRASKNVLEALDKKDAYHIFPPLMPNTSTRVILKKAKTDSSIRKDSINADLRNVKTPEEKQTPALDVQSMMEQLRKSPELLQTLAGLLEVQKKGTK